MNKRYALYITVFSIPAIGLICTLFLFIFFFIGDRRKSKLRLVSHPLDKVESLEDENDYNPMTAPPEPLLRPA